jgi:hypothetical protein
MKAAEAVDHRCDGEWQAALQAHTDQLSKNGREWTRKAAVRDIATILRLQWDSSWR